jgi:hypothetical protein
MVLSSVLSPVFANSLSVPSSGDPLAALIETALRPLAHVLELLIASELRRC